MGMTLGGDGNIKWLPEPVSAVAQAWLPVKNAIRMIAVTIADLV
jgi:hypothetical protein